MNSLIITLFLFRVAHAIGNDAPMLLNEDFVNDAVKNGVHFMVKSVVINEAEAR